MTNRERLSHLGIAIPEILLPGDSTPEETWAVIACDQFTSERTYWEVTKKIVSDKPSTLNMIIPECYLDDISKESDKKARIKAVNNAMGNALDKHQVRSLPPGLILLKRSTPNAKSRFGLLLAIDLETYDFSEKSTSRIRPTEGTIRERLPFRMAVRRKASLDLSHIILLIDDPEDSVMQAAASIAGRKLYDFDLMQNGGHISGSFIGESNLDPIVRALEVIAAKSELLFAVGDGNHALASAKEVWIEKKSQGISPNHPARYALVEVENIHDEGLHFHPIHRMLFGTDPADFLKYAAHNVKGEATEIKYITATGEGYIQLSVESGRLIVESLQEILDRYLNERPAARLDYIHGEDALREIALQEPDRIGIQLPDLDKEGFFNRIAKIGPYPRKAFSLGEAFEKRYYLESRRLRR